MIKVIENSDKDKFEQEVNDFLLQGFMVSSTACGFIQSEAYDFCHSYQAILVKKQV